MTATDTTQPGDGRDDVRRFAQENERLRRKLESLEGQAAAGRGARRRRTRGIVASVLVVLTSLCVVATAVGVWAQRTLASTDRFVALVAPLAEDPAVTGALAVRLTDEVFVALDVEDRVERALAQIPQLPQSGAVLAGPTTAGARNLIQREVNDLLESPAFA